MHVKGNGFETYSTVQALLHNARRRIHAIPHAPKCPVRRRKFTEQQIEVNGIKVLPVSQHVEDWEVKIGFRFDSRWESAAVISLLITAGRAEGLFRLGG